jgi:hypothetical protein
VATVVLLAGCTTRFDISGREWTKAGTQLPQITQDEMDCARRAVDARWSPETFVGGLADIAAVKVEDLQMSGSFNGCMAGKGYQPAG